MAAVVFAVSWQPATREAPIGPANGRITVDVWPDVHGGAWVVQIDTDFEPDALPLRINLNEAHLCGPEYHEDGQ